MRRLLALLENHPTVSFMAILALLFGVIFLAAESRTPTEDTEELVAAIKTSRTFSVEETGFVTTTARVKKSGVIDIVAVTGGTVQSIPVRVGQRVTAGTPLVILTNDYGVNAARLSAEKVRLESNFTERVFSLQKEINTRERKITDDNEELSNREEKNAIENLKLELRRLELNRETARLDAQIASASDAVLRPKSLVNGTVEFIGVRPGENITAGTLIATIRGNKSTDTLIATLPNEIARFVNPSGIGTLVLDEKQLPLTGAYFGQSENTLGLRSLTFSLSETTSAKLTESEFVTLLLPLVNTEGQFFVPIDAILSGANGESVLVLEQGQAVEKTVTLGDTIGSFVLIKTGLTITDTILLNRGIVPGDQVEIIQ